MQQKMVEVLAFRLAESFAHNSHLHIAVIWQRQKILGITINYIMSQKTGYLNSTILGSYTVPTGRQWRCDRSEWLRNVSNYNTYQMTRRHIPEDLHIRASKITSNLHSDYLYILNAVNKVLMNYHPTIKVKFVKCHHNTCHLTAPNQNMILSSFPTTAPPLSHTSAPELRTIVHRSYLPSVLPSCD
jgi:hypothetical protein